MATRKIFSVRGELIQKSQESMLTAVQIFNNPNITFKSESFIVLAIISWTYLLHAYYRTKKIEYRYYEQHGKRKFFDKTQHGADKYWELERCLNYKDSPVDKTVSCNLRFLIGLRHEIEHKMTTKIDDFMSGRFQACCLNYNEYLKKFFGDKFGIEKYLSFSLQFSALSDGQIDNLSEIKNLPSNISSYIEKFDSELSENDFNDSHFSYRVLLFKKSVNKKGQADRVIEFVDPNSEVAQGLNKEYWAIKDREKPKFLPSHIWKEMHKLGYVKFGQHQHTELFKKQNAKNPKKEYGVFVEKTWYWYESWLNFVKKHCAENARLYK